MFLFFDMDELNPRTLIGLTNNIIVREVMADWSSNFFLLYLFYFSD